MRAFITRQAASAIGWTQGDEIMYGREFAFHSLQHRLAATSRRRHRRRGPVHRLRRVPSARLPRDPKPGRQEIRPGPYSRGTENLRQRHHAGRAGPPPPAARAVQALAVRAGLN